MQKGHHHCFNAISAQCIDGNRQCQRRINTARQTKHHTLETILVDVIAHAHHQGVVNTGQLGRFVRNLSGRHITHFPI